MLNGLSIEGLLSERAKLDNFTVNSAADREANITSNEGMKLKIPQASIYDRIVNLIDNRRIVLEKKAEILHDYYGDALICKDLFKDYLKEKNKWFLLQSSATAGLLGMSAYLHLYHNTILMKKMGLLTSLIAIHAVSRHFSNDYLEKKVERPWKIHTYRMSKGLGPTNIPSNHHSDEVIISYSIKGNDFKKKLYLDFFSNKSQLNVTNLGRKIAVNDGHFNYFPESAHLGQFENLFEDRTHRFKTHSNDKKLKSINFI